MIEMHRLINVVIFFQKVFLFPMNFLLSQGMCSTPKLSKYDKLKLIVYEAIQSVSIDLCLSRLITYALSFTVDILFLEETSYLGSFFR